MGEKVFKFTSAEWDLMYGLEWEGLAFFAQLHRHFKSPLKTQHTRLFSLRRLGKKKFSP